MKKLLITDLDNTLYDWIGYFVPSFYSMAQNISDTLSIRMDKLLDEMRAIHRHYGDAEHPFAVLESPSVRAIFPDLTRSEIAEKIDSSFYIFNSNREKKLRLYDGVLDTLRQLRVNGVNVVAYTEARPLAVRDRLRRLEIQDYISTVYCREHVATWHPKDIPESADGGALRFVELPHHQKKPSPVVIRDICEDFGVDTGEVAYVGDSLFKDVLMANQAQVTAVWAKYGSHVDPELYQQLVKISHWSDEEIRDAKAFAEEPGRARPDVILGRDFGELLRAFPEFA